MSDKPIAAPILEKIVESQRRDVFLEGAITITQRNEIDENTRLMNIGVERARTVWPAVAIGGSAFLIAALVIGGMTYALSRSQDWRVIVAGLIGLAAVGGPIGISLGKAIKQFGALAEKLAGKS